MCWPCKPIWHKILGQLPTHTCGNLTSDDPGLCCVPEEYSNDAHPAQTWFEKLGKHQNLGRTNHAMSGGCGKCQSLCWKWCHQDQEEDHGRFLGQMTIFRARFDFGSIEWTLWFFGSPILNYICFWFATVCPGPASGIQDHESFDYVNQTVEKELCWDPWHCLKCLVQGEVVMCLFWAQLGQCMIV